MFTSLVNYTFTLFSFRSRWGKSNFIFVLVGTLVQFIKCAWVYSLDTGGDSFICSGGFDQRFSVIFPEEVEDR